jgi:TRAP-type C4-dicarboxylate transport system permease small subunit
MPPENNSAAEEADLLRKQIATARILLLIVAVATLLSAFILLPTLSYPYTLLNIRITSAVSAIYFLLAIRAKKKPYTAIRIGLLLLLLVILFDIFLNPFGPYSRWQSKTLSILLLFLGIGDSKDAQRKMK